MRLYVKQRWTDPRLAFHPTDGVTQLDIRPKDIHKIWLPDIFFRNAKSSADRKADTADKALMTVSSDGEVWYVYE